jgi:hypothetical protein
MVAAIPSKGWMQPTQPRPTDDEGRLRSRVSGALRTGFLFWTTDVSLAAGWMVTAAAGLLTKTPRGKRNIILFMNPNCAAAVRLSMAGLKH